jgi:hypothetical protein
MLPLVRNWLGLLLGAAIFTHEALTTKDPLTMTTAVGLMGIRFALGHTNGKGSA